MNHRKHKQSKKLKQHKSEPYSTDPPDAKCPYCGKSKTGCSYINSLSRAWARGACAKNHNNQKKESE